MHAPVEFSSRDLYVDFLCYHVRLRRYVVIELKAVPFDPSFVGTTNAYLPAFDEAESVTTRNNSKPRPTLSVPRGESCKRRLNESLAG